jgi:hypothetical protein
VTQHKEGCGKLEEKQPDRKEGDFALCKLLFLLLPAFKLQILSCTDDKSRDKKSKTVEFKNDQHLKIT